MLRFQRFALVMFLAASLTGCGVASAVTGLPVSPAAIANQTKIDEQVGLVVTLAYTAAARAAALAITTGVVKDKATIARIGVLNSQAYAAVLAVRAAYEASNAGGYFKALKQARVAIADLLAAVKG